MARRRDKLCVLMVRWILSQAWGTPARARGLLGIELVDVTRRASEYQHCIQREQSGASAACVTSSHSFAVQEAVRPMLAFSGHGSGQMGRKPTPSSACSHELCDLLGMLNHGHCALHDFLELIPVQSCHAPCKESSGATEIELISIAWMSAVWLLHHASPHAGELTARCRSSSRRCSCIWSEGHNEPATSTLLQCGLRSRHQADWSS